MYKKILYTGLLLLISCTIRVRDNRDRFYNEDGLLVKRIFFSDSVTIKAEATFKHDSIFHGYAKRFNQAGTLIWYCEFQNGKKNGNETTYDSLGHIVRIVNFQYGKPVYFCGDY